MAIPEALAALVATPIESVAAVLAGGALGLLFYAGLWWTVRRAASFRRPGLGILASMLLRMAVALGGFHLVGGRDWARLLLCLAGFVLARAAVIRLTRLPPLANGQGRAPTGIRHAP
jgi:F1F0 ATPase subunit 2